MDGSCYRLIGPSCTTAFEFSSNNQQITRPDKEVSLESLFGQAQIAHVAVVFQTENSITVFSQLQKTTKERAGGCFEGTF